MGTSGSITLYVYEGREWKEMRQISRILFGLGRSRVGSNIREES